MSNLTPEKLQKKIDPTNPVIVVTEDQIPRQVFTATSIQHAEIIVDELLHGFLSLAPGESVPDEQRDQALDDGHWIAPAKHGDVEVFLTHPTYPKTQSDIWDNLQ